MQFQLTSKLNATIPTFTLTCTSTGGPATTVSWKSNNSTVTEDSAHHITSQILTDAENATYTNTLTVTGRLVGEYQCTVSNNKPSSSSGMLVVVGKKYNHVHIWWVKLLWVHLPYVPNTHCFLIISCIKFKFPACCNLPIQPVNLNKQT